MAPLELYNPFLFHMKLSAMPPLQFSIALSSHFFIKRNIKNIKNEIASIT